METTGGRLLQISKLLLKQVGTCFKQTGGCAKLEKCFGFKSLGTYYYTAK